MSKNLSLTLVALHGAVAAQFAAAGHWVEGSHITKQEKNRGHVVNFVPSPDGPYLRLSSRDVDLPNSGDTVRKFTISVGVPTGPNLRRPVMLENLGSDRDTVIAAIVEAVGNVEGSTSDDVKIILADGKPPGTPPENA